MNDYFPWDINYIKWYGIETHTHTHPGEWKMKVTYLRHFHALRILESVACLTWNIVISLECFCFYCCSLCLSIVLEQIHINFISKVFAFFHSFKFIKKNRIFLHILIFSINNNTAAIWTHLHVKSVKVTWSLLVIYVDV